MAKFDVEAAYRNIVVHPEDQYLLEMKCRGQFFVDLALPFGLCSAPYIFNCVADVVEWIILNKYSVADLIHYLDDFLTPGSHASEQCARNLQTSLAVCRSLGLPLHPNKCIGPSTRLVVLGIQLDSVKQSARLPAEKLSALQDLIQAWRSRRWCTRRQLESLIGHFHHIAKVVWPGRTFLRRISDLLCCFRSQDHPICLNAEFQLDIQWWHDFLASLHGVSFSLFFWLHQSIAYKELFPVVVASHLWGQQWCRQHVLFCSDNEAVVHILISRTLHCRCSLPISLAGIQAVGPRYTPQDMQ